MKHIPHSQQQPIETPNLNFGTALATPSLGATEVSVVRQSQQPGGFNPFHLHDREEVMVMLEGEVRVEQEDLTGITLQKGDSLIIPANLSHRLANQGTATASWLIISPAQVKFLKQDGTAATPPWSK